MSVFKRGRYYGYSFMLRGKRYRGTTKQTTERAAKLFEARLQSEVLERGALTPRNSIRLRDLWPRFDSWVGDVVKTGTLKYRTRRFYRSGWRILEETPMANMTLNQIDKSAITSLELRGSPSYRNQVLRTLRRMLGMAHEWNLLVSVPRIKLYKENERQTIIDKETELRLMPHMGQPLRDVYLICADAGCRPDEVFRIRIENINWQAKTIFISSGKTPKARRHVGMSQRMFDALFVRVSDRKEGWLFPSKHSKSGHIVSVAKAFQEAREAAGLPKEVILYAGRHAFGTYVYEQTGNLKLVMEAMGHSDVKTAMRYQHPALETVRDVIDERNNPQKEAVQ